MIKSASQASFESRSIVRIPSSNSLGNLSQGVSLAERIHMGNRAACLTLLQKLDDNQDRALKTKVQNLIKLIEKTRCREPLSLSDTKNKIKLQEMIATEVNNKVF